MVKQKTAPKTNIKAKNKSEKTKRAEEKAPKVVLKRSGGKAGVSLRAGSQEKVTLKRGKKRSEKVEKVKRHEKVTKSEAAEKVASKAKAVSKSKAASKPKTTPKKPARVRNQNRRGKKHHVTWKKVLAVILALALIAVVVCIVLIQLDIIDLGGGPTRARVEAACEKAGYEFKDWSEEVKKMRQSESDHDDPSSYVVGYYGCSATAEQLKKSGDFMLLITEMSLNFRHNSYGERALSNIEPLLPEEERGKKYNFAAAYSEDSETGAVFYHALYRKYQIMLVTAKKSKAQEILSGLDLPKEATEK